MSGLLNPFILAPAGGGGGGSLPAGATWHLDFINEFYYAGGAAQPVGDLLGGGFDASKIGPTGIDVRSDFAPANRPEAIGDLFTDIVAGFAAGFTFVVEIDGHVVGTFLQLMNNADPDLANKSAEAWSQSIVAIDDWASMFVNGGTRPADGIHRIAYTFYRNIGGGLFQSALSVDGAAAITGNTSYGGTWFTPLIVGVLTSWDQGAYNYGWFGRSITGYPVKPSTDLPALSALV
ncbi:MAG: hypothetical protein E5W82_10875 [Mesorhizobium sp.]|nr:MAG: hypothetical protein E5W82_10875 [Mesorhizobium sp.]